MKKLSFLFLLLPFFVNAQDPSYAIAPMNERPLESIGYIVTGALQGDVIHYQGKFYNKNRERILENGESFRTLSQGTEKEAKAANRDFLVFDEKGNLTQRVTFGTSGYTMKSYYEYFPDGKLSKMTSVNKVVTTYQYDKIGRVIQEVRNVREEQVVSTFNYKKEGDLLKIEKQTTYPAGDKETVEFHYQDGRLMYNKSALGNEYVCLPDKKGNCTFSKTLSDGKPMQKYANVVYRDEFTPENIVVKNDVKEGSYYATNIPKVMIGDRVINAKTGSVGSNLYIYISDGQQYMVAENFYDREKVKPQQEVSVRQIQTDTPYLGIWHPAIELKVLKHGDTELRWVSKDNTYRIFYDKETGNYLVFDLRTKGEPMSVARYARYEAPILMYVNIAEQKYVNLIEGENVTSRFGWESKPLNDKEAVLIKDGQPLYILPITPQPEDLKIYTGRFYNGEQIP